MRRILANLLCEEELARTIPGRHRRGAPSRTAVATASWMGTFLRAFAREGDRLWTPTPVDPERVPNLPGLPSPVLESGPLRDLPAADEVLAWCETQEAGTHRVRPREPSSSSLEGPLYEVVWRLPVPDPDVVAAVHHRQFSMWIAEDLGCVLANARMVDSVRDLERTLGSKEAPARWVVKAPWSAAGRDRYIESNGPALSTSEARWTVERLFARHGSLLFEPWMDRVADFGVAALLTAFGPRIVGIHGQQVDARGRFLGIDLQPALPEAHRERLLEAVDAVASGLQLAGYVGPFGVDAWTYRRADGSIVLNPLGEINARMTFGLIAWALRERLPAGETLRWLRPLAGGERYPPLQPDQEEEPAHQQPARE